MLTPTIAAPMSRVKRAPLRPLDVQLPAAFASGCALAFADRDARREAALPGATERAVHDVGDRLRPVAVIHHEGEVLRAAERLETLSGRSAARRDVPRDGARSDERNAGNVLVLEDA